MRPVLVHSAARLAAALVLLAAPSVSHSQAHSAAPDSAGDRWYATHVLIARTGWLAVRADQSVGLGDSVIVFDAGRAARRRAVASIVTADSARAALAAPRPVTRSFGWSLLLLPDLAPTALACFEPALGGPGAPTFVEEWAPFALCGLPAGALALGSDGDTLSAAQLEALVPALSRVVPRAYVARPALRFGRRFRGFGHELCQVDLGIPAWKRRPDGEATMDSVTARRVFLLDGRALGAQSFSRVTGLAEHVDIDPPRLNRANWFDTMDQTAGFLSRDGGRTWEQLVIDVGFEGIDWSAVRLSRGMPRRWGFYLYTPH